MARAFDNRNFIQEKQQTFYAVDTNRSNHHLSSPYVEPIITNGRQKSGIG
jgi:hypothetical protein